MPELHLPWIELTIVITTLVVVLVEDLLPGIAAGIVLKMIIHVANGVPLITTEFPLLPESPQHPVHSGARA